MKENLVYEKAFRFSIRVVNLYKYLCKDKKDFLWKMNIALKECSETIYWLELLVATNYMDANASKSIIYECTELNRILIAIVKTTREQLRINNCSFFIIN